MDWNERARGCYEYSLKVYKPLQKFFHWKYSGGVIAFLYAAALGALGLATAYTDGGYFFNWAYALSALGFIWSLSWWLTSDILERKRKLTRRQLRGLDAHTHKPFIALLTGGIVMAALVFLCACALIHGTSVRKRLQAYSDYLVAGDTPTPDNVCEAIPKGALRILLGPMAAWATSFPSNVIVIDGDTILKINRSADGRISLSTDIYDKNHDIIAEIKDNHYDVDSSAFKVVRDNLSDLSVFIRHDKEQVLDVRYLNPTTISISGVFRSKSSELKVSADGTYLNGRSLGHLGICSGNASGAAFDFNTR
jgi:hypothetical protein